MKRSLHHTLRLLACLCLLLPALLVAGALHAQTEPPPTKTPTASPPTLTPAPPYQLQSDQVLAGDAPGQAQIVLNFTTSETAADDERLVLRFTQPGSVIVVESAIDQQPAQATLQRDRMGYAWDDLPADSLPHALLVTVTVGSGIVSDRLSFQFIDAEGEALGNVLILSPFNMERLAAARPGAAVQPDAGTPTGAAATAATTAATTGAATLTVAPANSPAPKPTQPPTVPATITPAPTATIAVAPAATEEAAPPATLPADGGADDGAGFPLLPLLGGLLLVALLGIVALLFLRRRPPPRPARPAGAPLAPPPPLSPGPEAITRTLTLPVYLELAGDPSRRFFIQRTPFAIGRDAGGDLVIDENFPEWQTVSREHAIITRHPQGYTIEDRGSRNGLRVNGRPTAKNLLRHGAQIFVGGVAFRFVDESQAN